MLAAIKRNLESNETVKDYYDAKCKILRGADISETHIADLLTNGLPERWRELLYGKRFTSLADWLMMIQDIEADHKKDKPKQRYTAPVHYLDSKSNSHYNQSGQTKTAPLCHICKRRGNRAYHWHSDCPHRDPNHSNASANKPNTPTQPNPINPTLTLQQLNP